MAAAPGLLQVDALVAGLRQAVDGIHHEVEAVQIVQHRHVEGRGDGALFLVAADVDVVVVGAAVGQPVDQPRVGMEGKDDRLILGEDLVEIHVAQPVRVLGLRLQLHEVDYIDCLPQTGDKGIYLKQQLKDKLIEHKQYIDKHGEDLPEIRHWKWDGTI